MYQEIHASAPTAAAVWGRTPPAPSSCPGESGRRWIRLLAYAFALLLGLGLGFAAYAYVLLGELRYLPVPLQLVSGEGRYQSERDQELLKANHVYAPADVPLLETRRISGDVFTVLVFGIDTRDPEGEQDIGRSDSMILLSLDKRHKRVKLTSLMRDSRVAYFSDGEDMKLNAAYPLGGVAALLNTINQQMNLDVQHYMKLDFNAVPEIVDAVGGIRVDIPSEDLEETNGIIQAYGSEMSVDVSASLLAAAGVQQLNGVQALSWSRLRAVGNDQGRTQRQRRVLEALIQKFNAEPLLGKMRCLKAVLPHIATNLSRQEIVRLFLHGYLRRFPVLDYRLPEDGLYVSSEDTAWDLVIDWDSQRAALHRFIYEEG